MHSHSNNIDTLFMLSHEHHNIFNVPGLRKQIERGDVHDPVAVGRDDLGVARLRSGVAGDVHQLLGAELEQLAQEPLVAAGAGRVNDHHRVVPLR